MYMSAAVTPIAMAIITYVIENMDVSDDMFGIDGMDGYVVAG
jgi:hypothetical protein